MSKKESGFGQRNPDQAQSETSMNDQYLHVPGSIYAPLGDERVVPGTYDSLPQGQTNVGSMNNSPLQQVSDYEDVGRHNYENMQTV